METKNEGGREGHSNSALVWHCGDQGSFTIWMCCLTCFHVKNLFPFPLASALLIGDFMMNRESGVKVFLSVITAPIVLAHLIDFLIRRCYVNPQMFKYSSCKFVPPCLFKIKIRPCQFIGADVLFPPILLALWKLTFWIGKANRRCEMVKNVKAAERLYYINIACLRS